MSKFKIVAASIALHLVKISGGIEDGRYLCIFKRIVDERPGLGLISHVSDNFVELEVLATDVEG